MDAELVRRIAREEFQRAAEIVGRLGAERAGALRHPDLADILAGDRAADVEAVDVAVAGVAEGNAVEREAELVLVEAADRDARGPFIGAEGIGGLEVDAGQFLDRLQGAGAGGEFGDVAAGELLDLAGLAAADHHDMILVRAVVGGGHRPGRRVLREGGTGKQHRSAGEQNGKLAHGGFPPGFVFGAGTVPGSRGARICALQHRVAAMSVARP